MMDILKSLYRGVGEEKRWMDGEKGRVGIRWAESQTTVSEKMERPDVLFLEWIKKAQERRERHATRILYLILNPG